MAFETAPNDDTGHFCWWRQVSGGKLEEHLLPDLGAFRGFHIGPFRVPVADQATLWFVVADIFEIQAAGVAIVPTGFPATKTDPSEQFKGLSTGD